jgi:DNA processing protein
MDLYPAENLGLAEKIAAAGAVVSEYPMTFPPSPQTFPYRNRIVAGWSTGILVVEAGLSSGALITANQAIDHGRLVYAVPGPIDRPSAAGSNRLIQQGAKLVMSASDILDDFQSLLPEKRTAPGKKNGPVEMPGMSAEEQAILEVLSSEEASIDSIVIKTGLPAPKVSSTLLALEMKRLARQLPGQRFVKPS